MTIWKDVPMLICVKMPHVRKIGGKGYNAFIVTYGDIPVVDFNLQTRKTELVVNNRGKAYAARKRQKYRKRYNRQEEKRVGRAW